MEEKYVEADLGKGGTNVLGLEEIGIRVWGTNCSIIEKQ
jgi:hypothetical protein